MVNDSKGAVSRTRQRTSDCRSMLLVSSRLLTTVCSTLSIRPAGPADRPAAGAPVHCPRPDVPTSVPQALGWHLRLHHFDLLWVCCESTRILRTLRYDCCSCFSSRSPTVGSGLSGARVRARRRDRIPRCRHRAGSQIPGFRFSRQLSKCRYTLFWETREYVPLKRTML